MFSPLLQTNTSIVCPITGSSPQIIDLTSIYEIEGRIEEVAFVTAEKAPELLARFNEGYLDLHKKISLLEYEYIRSENEANRIKSIVILDKAPAILESKGLLHGKSRSGSEDQRNAVLAQDEQYQEALDQSQKIRCIIELLRGKMKGIEWAYTSTKKILGEGSFNTFKRSLNGDTGDAPVGRSNNEYNGFGKAKY